MKENAEKFLKLMNSDEKLRKIFDNIIDESIWSVATAIGVERGLPFTRADLESAITRHLGLGEFKLSDDGGAGKCKTDSGCRSPSVYCKSNRLPSLGEIGQKFGRE